MTNREDSLNSNSGFDSVDFNNFLHQKLMRSNDSTNVILGFGDYSSFRSKESFVGGFLSKDWDMKRPSTKETFINDDEKPFGLSEHSSSTIFTASATAANMVQKSQDWIKFNTLGKHVDIPYSIGIFSSTTNSKQKSESKQSGLIYPCIGSKSKALLAVNLQDKPLAALSKSSVPFTMNDATKKKRKRAPRKKVIPHQKHYLVPTDIDVLMGRGGKSNHHPGNVQYRAEIDGLQEHYKKTHDKDGKTSISEKLVLHIQSHAGNFLEKDKDGWYVIDDIVARRKVSQALREDKNPEKRRAKRLRFLTKRTRREEDTRRKNIQM